MKIAHILPHSVTFPLEHHNGRYEWVLRLARIQADQGHDVTLYCHPQSYIDGLRTAGVPTSGVDKKSNNMQTFQHALDNAHDIYHSHFDNLHYEMAHKTRSPIVFTQHWWPTAETISLSNNSLASNVYAVPPTQYMYNIDVEQNIQTNGTIYHGVDLTMFQPTADTKNDRLLYVGRISPEKNVELAVSTALKAGIGLDIIGKVAEKNQSYWQDIIRMIQTSDVQYLGPKPIDELPSYYSRASALLFPSDVNEPFGLVAIEAQACGTPIIMKRGGSRGELVLHGNTGFLCNTEAEFIEAALQARHLSPENCTAFAAQFDINDMASKYEVLYRDLIAR